MEYYEVHDFNYFINSIWKFLEKFSGCMSPGSLDFEYKIQKLPTHELPEYVTWRKNKIYTPWR